MEKDDKPKWRGGLSFNWGAKKTPILKATLFKTEPADPSIPPQKTELVVGDGNLMDSIQRTLANFKAMIDNDNNK